MNTVLADAVIRDGDREDQSAVAVVGALTVIVAGTVGVEAYIHAGPPPVRLTPTIEQAVVKATPGKPWAAERRAGDAIPQSCTAGRSHCQDRSPRRCPSRISTAVGVAIIVLCESLPGVSLVHSVLMLSVLLFAFYADGTPVPGWPAELATLQLRRAL